MHEAKRRDFLKAGIGAAVAMGSAWPLSVCRGAAVARRWFLYALASVASACVKLFGQRGVSPLQVVTLRPEFDSNCDGGAAGMAAPFDVGSN
jgi:hypothetical protein